MQSRGPASTTPARQTRAGRSCDSWRTPETETLSNEICLSSRRQLEQIEIRAHVTLAGGADAHQPPTQHTIELRRALARSEGRHRLGYGLPDRIAARIDLGDVFTAAIQLRGRVVRAKHIYIAAGIDVEIVVASCCAQLTLQHDRIARAQRPIINSDRVCGVAALDVNLAVLADVRGAATRQAKIGKHGAGLIEDADTRRRRGVKL